MFDMDHTDERTAEIKEHLRSLPYVVFVWISISGKGLKVVVRTDAENLRQYAVSYDIVVHALTKEVDFP